MAPHSSTLAWKIPWTEEPGGLQSMGSLRVGHNWTTSLSLFTFMHWRRKWQPTPEFLLRKSHGQRSLVGYNPWRCRELDKTEWRYTHKYLLCCSNNPNCATDKAMAPHSRTLAWKIPWTEEPGGLKSMGSLSRAQLNNFTFTFHFHALEKEIATHSSVLD